MSLPRTWTAAPHLLTPEERVEEIARLRDLIELAKEHDLAELARGQEPNRHRRVETTGRVARLIALEALARGERGREPPL